MKNDIQTQLNKNISLLLNISKSTIFYKKVSLAENYEKLIFLIYR